MSSIQSIQSSASQWLTRQNSISDAAQVGESSTLPMRLEERIDSVIGAQNLSDDQKSSLKTDLEAAIRSAVGSGSPPDPSQIDTAVKDVFKQYGLDADQLTSQLRPQGPPPGGPQPGGGACGGSYTEYDESDTSNTLLELLQQFASSASDSNSSDGSSSTNTADKSSQISEFVFAALIGFNAQV